MTSKIKTITAEELDLNDTTAETRFLHNNTNSYATYGQMLGAPIRALEKLALGAFFTSKEEFESDPTNLGPMDTKLMHHALMSHLQALEGILKAFKRHGEDIILDGDATVVQKDKETGEVTATINLTAVENLLQAACIGTYVEILANTAHAGPEEKIRILNTLLANTRDNKDTEIKSVEEMKAFLKEGDKLEDLMIEMMRGYGDDIKLREIFPSASKLAEALSKHKDGEEDFMVAYKRGLHTKLNEMDPIDRNILANKAEELTKELLAELLTSDFPSQ